MGGIPCKVTAIRRAVVGVDKQFRKCREYERGFVFCGVRSKFAITGKNETQKWISN